jgi:hypothetical protein
MGAGEDERELVPPGEGRLVAPGGGTLLGRGVIRELHVQGVDVEGEILPVDSKVALQGPQRPFVTGLAPVEEDLDIEAVPTQNAA